MVERTIQHKNSYNYTYRQLNKFVNKLKKDFKGSKYNSIFGIPRGGLVFAVYLSHRLNLPITNRIKSDTIVVDDICDTGLTLKSYEGVIKISLVAKPKGLNKIKNLIYDEIVPDDTWVYFPWEIKK